MRRLAALVVLCLSGFALAGCTGTHGKNQANITTTGQNAVDTGTITTGGPNGGIGGSGNSTQSGATSP